ncbi:invasion associated locus B family protein [Breoghania sp. L-A4]|uniref:invasion associated locus B family protein n=1 Tax=Breoghania sp. L-A4 TaxID=2304600 RepID=UPI000E360CC5|nr:invasion associated locus B family protein [Breoghania sp. L-A4]AXS40580.1 hypothetical protein D1F64_11575 [Breoghania sp. L-A4]
MQKMTLSTAIPVRAGGKAARMLGMMLAGGVLGAVASGAALAAGSEAPVEPEKSPWTKQCSPPDATGKQTCMTSQVLYDDQGRLSASVAVETVTGRPEPRLLVAVPNRMLLQPGLVVQIDDAVPQKLAYRICLADRCFADELLDAPALGRMRRGETMRVGLMDAASKPATLTFPLAGFAGVIDGAPETPADAQQ